MSERREMGSDRGHAFCKSDAVDAEQVKNTLWRLTTTGIRDDNFMAFEGVVSMHLRVVSRAPA